MIRPAVCWLLVFFVPGFLITRFTYKNNRFNIIENIPVWFCMSLVFFILPCSLTFFLKWNLNILLYVFITMLAMLFILQFLFNKRKKTREAIFVYDNHKQHYLLKGVFVFAALGFSVIVFWLGGYLEGDGWFHVAWIKTLLQGPEYYALDPFIKGFNADICYGYNLWYMLLAFVSFISGTDAIMTWQYLPGLLTPVTLFAFYLLVKQVSEKEKFSLISGLVFAVYCGIYEGLYIFQWSQWLSQLPSLIIVPVLFVFVLRYIKYEEIENALVSALLSVLVLIIHGYIFSLLWIYLFIYTLMSVFIGKDKTIIKKIMVIAYITAGLSIPYLFQKFVTYDLSNPAYWRETGFLLKLSKKISIISPACLWLQDNLVARWASLYAYILLPFIALSYKKQKWVIFAAAGMLFPPIIMLNPLLVPVLSKLAPMELVERTIHLIHIPTFMILGYFSCIFSNYIGKILPDKICAGKDCSSYIAVLLFVLVLLLPVTNRTLVNNISKKIKEPDIKFYELRGKTGVLKFIKKNISKQSIILADRKMSRLIPVYTKHYIVATHPLMVSLTCSDIFERIHSVRTVLESSSGIEKIRMILEKYEVDYIIVPIKAAASSNILIFDNNPDIFNKIYMDDSCLMYRYGNG